LIANLFRAAIAMRGIALKVAALGGGNELPIKIVE
jgi:hypothetical protein